MNFSLSSFSAIFFDLDGTLLEGSDVHFQNCVFQTGQSFGLETNIPRGMSLRYFLQLSFPEYDEEFREQFITKNYKNMMENPRPVQFFSDVIPFLESLPDIPRAIVTNCVDFEVDLTRRHVDLSQYFKTIISRSFPGIVHGKPHPDIYLRASEYFVTPPEQCIAFEDSETGLLSAKNAGMFTVAVNRYNDIDTRLADMVIRDFSEIEENLSFT